VRSSGLQGLPRSLRACRRSLLWLGCLLMPLVAQALPSLQEVRRGFQPSETYILSREGELLQRLRTDMQVRRGQWVALSDTSPALRLALLVITDCP